MLEGEMGFEIVRFSDPEFNGIVNEAFRKASEHKRNGAFGVVFPDMTKRTEAREVAFSGGSTWLAIPNDGSPLDEDDPPWRFSHVFIQTITPEELRKMVDSL